MFRILIALFVLIGLGLVAYGGWHVARSYAHTHAPDVVRIEGTITGYHHIVSEVEEAGGRIRTSVWFPQPEFRFTDPAGRTRKVVDPGCQIVERYRAGDTVTVAYVPADAPIEKGSLTALLVEPGALIDDWATRYLFWVAVIVVGLPFIILPLWVGVPSSEGQAFLLDQKLLPQLPFTPRHFLWAIFGLFAFAGVMASWDHLMQLLPTGRGGELVEAAREGDLAAVRRLVAEGADVDYHDRNTGETPIMTAYYYGHPEVARLLLKGEFDPAVEDKVGRNLVYYAVRAGDRAALEKLLAAGAPVTSSYRDVLSEAIARRTPDLALLLVAQGHPLDYITEGRAGKRFYPGDLAILAGQPPVVAEIARRGGPFAAPRPFVDVALGRATAEEGALRFGKVTLSQWRTLCEAKGE